MSVQTEAAVRKIIDRERIARWHHEKKVRLNEVTDEQLATIVSSIVVGLIAVVVSGVGLAIWMLLR